MSLYERSKCYAVLCRSVTLCDTVNCSPPGSSVHGDSPGKNTGVDCYALLLGIFPTQGLNPGLPHCRKILYQLSHQESPRILEWVAYPFSDDLGSFHPGQMDFLLCDSLPRRHFRFVHWQKQYSNRLRRNCNALVFLF